MSHTLTKLYFHCVFRTKQNQPFLIGTAAEKIDGYLAGIARNHNAHLIRSGGISNHRHLLLELKPVTCISDIIRLLKSNSSKWLRETYADQRDFAWQTGYSAFTINESLRETIIRYINNQKEHHRTQTVIEELKMLYEKHRVEYEMEWLED